VGFFTKTKYLCCALSLLILAMVSGTFATWEYASQPATPVTQTYPFLFEEFYYAPEEVIPGGSIEAPLGQNHLALIEMILNEPSYGLNATKKPIIHNVLKNPGNAIYCDQNVQGGNLKHLMIEASTSTEQLYFVISKVSNTEYHAFTLLYNDLRNGAIGSEISVYKTVLEKGTDGVWRAPRSYVGYAEIFDPGIVQKSINCATWHQR